MPDFLYRFRPVDKLLGRNGFEGELSGTYIYFASPEQLNDPLEGYRELFFSGDAIVWHQLFKRYIACLIVRNYQYLSGFELNQKDFPDVYDLSILPPEVREPGKDVISTFLSNSNIQRHIHFLAEGERRVSKEELTVHLNSIQVYAMKLVSELYIKIGVKPVDTKLKDMGEARSLEASSALLSVCGEGSPGSIDTARAIGYAVALYMAETELFISNYESYKKESGDKKWRRLVHSFISQFVESLKKLSHREWYTACFMENCDNSAIWGTYGDNHAGVCLKFKTHQSEGKAQLAFNMPVALSSTGSIWESAKLTFEKVNYVTDVGDLDFFRSIGIYPRNTLLKNWYLSDSGQRSTCYSALENTEEWIESYWKGRQLSITSKMKDWISENEYRLILQNGMPDYENYKNRCLKYDFDSLEGIIFGIRTPEIEKYQIIQVIEDLCDKHKRKEFNIYQAHHDAANKTINYRSLVKVSCENPN
ncbi:DUF2971 domain-containing protein [Pseudomonas sputi]|uniref:DUF2971 domain-containing protein n=1 Tax=Pseudomonas sputi TaxID=2892325 RepID=UPI001F3809E0|nr:DUF2971 domain-containing protein [Pseudomonas sputi]